MAEPNGIRQLPQRFGIHFNQIEINLPTIAFERISLFGNIISKKFGTSPDTAPVPQRIPQKEYIFALRRVGIRETTITTAIIAPTKACPPQKLKNDICVYVAFHGLPPIFKSMDKFLCPSHIRINLFLLLPDYKPLIYKKANDYSTFINAIPLK